jgi:hypothetical protein
VYGLASDNKSVAAWRNSIRGGLENHFLSGIAGANPAAATTHSNNTQFHSCHGGKYAYVAGTSG